MFSFWWLLGAVRLILWAPTLLTITPGGFIAMAVHGCSALCNSCGVLNDRKDCRVPSITYSTIEEVLCFAAAYAHQNNLKASRFSHTIEVPSTGSMKTELFLQAKLMRSRLFLQTAFIDLGFTVERSKSIIGNAGCSLRYDDRVPLSRSGDGEYDFLGFQPSIVLFKSARSSGFKLLGSARNVNGKSVLAATFVGFKNLVAIGLKNGLIYTGNPVVVIREKFRPQIHVYTQQECFKKLMDVPQRGNVYVQKIGIIAPQNGYFCKEGLVHKEATGSAVAQKVKEKEDEMDDTLKVFGMA
ncbi:hypothetical protein SADUNF_Sadunf06G0192700 [Salix dunnii]|uniref:Uncharacterized protein n=1 Tax=Salix dunnii TaxID=1413687 RepID=A0A835JZT0_9ROSI|nr:hypothetical protein SADUNF_Sadunf06G0192700 [Salix dunnii]